MFSPWAVSPVDVGTGAWIDASILAWMLGTKLRWSDTVKDAFTGNEPFLVFELVLMEFSLL